MGALSGKAEGCKSDQLTSFGCTIVQGCGGTLIVCHPEKTVLCHAVKVMISRNDMPACYVRKMMKSQTRA